MKEQKTRSKVVLADATEDSRLRQNRFPRHFLSRVRSREGLGLARGAAGGSRPRIVDLETFQRGSGGPMVRIGNLVRCCLLEASHKGESRNGRRGRCAAVAIAGVLTVVMSLQS